LQQQQQRCDCDEYAAAPHDLRPKYQRKALAGFQHAASCSRIPPCRLLQLLHGLGTRAAALKLPVGDIEIESLSAILIEDRQRREMLYTRAEQARIIAKLYRCSIVISG